MFLLSFVKGSKSAEGGGGGKNPLADLDPADIDRGGPYPLADLDRGSNSRGVQIR